MAQSVEDQLEIIKAYAEGKPVYRRPNHKHLGEKVTEKNHQFDFVGSVYSLTPIDWCTGREAGYAFAMFMEHGSEKDDAPSRYSVTYSAKDELTNKVNAYSTDAVNVVDTFSIFIAGAEWVLRNKDKGIDYEKSLQNLREKGKERQAQMEFDRDRILYSH